MSMAKNRGELTIAVRMKGRPVVLVGEGPAADEHRTLLTKAGAVIVAEGSKATFAIVIDDRAAVSRLKMRGALVYAVGEPELCDFTLASDPEPVKATRKVKQAPAIAPEPVVEPPVVQPRREKVAKVVRERPVKPPREPVERVPREPLQLPSISFEPAVRALATVKAGLASSWKRSIASLAPKLTASTPLTRTVASNIQSRVERARARPISLDLALVKGGLLDEQVTATDENAAAPSTEPEVQQTPASGL
jgi:hypothetical protein